MKLKKLLCSVLALAMVLSTMGTVAFAAGETDEVTVESISVATAEALAKALTSDKKNIAITLGNDINVPMSSLGSQTPGSGEYKLGGEATESIVIDLNNHNLTITTTYMSAIGAKNDDATITIKNGSMNSTGNSATTWNINDLIFANCNYEFENVTFNKEVALTNTGKTVKMDDVTIKGTGDYYALWIQAEGQTVNIDGLTITTTGRGIKIDEQYSNENVALVTLSVSNATFSTAKKAAIMVKSAKGAKITTSDVNITSVAADSENIVWVDEDSKVYQSFVTVNGNAAFIEGTVATVDGTPYDSVEAAFSAAVNDNEVKIYAAGTYAPAFSGKNITVTGAVDGVVFDNIGPYNMKSADVSFNNVTFDYYPNVNYTGLQHSGNLTYNNCTINGQVFLYGASETFNNCTFNQNSSDAYNVWTYGAKDVTFDTCTFNSAGKSVLVYKEAGKGEYTVNVKTCTFNASESVEGKSAIEIDSSLWQGYIVNVTGSKTENFAAGSVSGDTLWNHKKGSAAVVTVDGRVVEAACVNTTTNKGYYLIEKAFAEAKDGDTITLLRDIKTDATLTINKDITLDLGGQTLTPAGGSEWNVIASGDVKITNGTINLTDVTGGSLAFFGVSEKLTLDETVKVTGKNVTGSIFYLTWGDSVLTLNGAKIEIENHMGDTALIKGEPQNGVLPKVSIDGANIKITNGQRGFNNVDVTIQDSTISLTGLAQHGFRGVSGTIDNTKLTVASLESGIKNNNGEVLTIGGSSTVVLDTANDDNNKPYNILNTAKLNITSGTYNVDPTAYIVEDTEAVYDEATSLYNVVPTRTLTFATNEGSEIDAVIKANGTEIDLSEYKPTRSGYRFAGWYKDAELKEAITSIILSEDTTVYAKWKKNSTGSVGGGASLVGVVNYTLGFETDGGTTIEDVSKVRNTTVDLSKYITTKEGYSFDGWYIDKALTEKVTSVKMTENITLYAKWVEGDGEQTQNPSYRPDIMSDSHDAYILGREDGLIHPEATITRAEAATIFFRLLDEEVRTEGLTRENGFADVNESDWFNTAVSTLANLEVLTGRTEDTFAPNAPITRAELTTIVARLSEASYDGEDKFSDIAGHWARNYINIAASIHWVQGENDLFRPDDNMTRAEVVTLINRALNRQPENAADLAVDMTVWPDNTDKTAWYYLAIQEATHSHSYEMKADGVHEAWTGLSENPDWTALEQ